MSLITPVITPQPILPGLQPGINHCNNSAYHADRGYLSSSVIKTLYKSLDKYREEYLEGKKAAHSERTLSTFAEGSYVHSCILEPHLTDSEFALFPGWRKQGQEYEQFKAENSHKTILSVPQLERCKGMLEAYKRLPIAYNMMQGGFSEQTICGILQSVPVKVRFDRINPDKGYIIDVKTTSYGSDLDTFKQTVLDFSYDLSAALYIQMAEQYYGKPFEFYFLVLSKRDFTANIYSVSQETRRKGSSEVTAGLSKYKRAIESGIWTESGLNSNSTTERESEYEILEV